MRSKARLERTNLELPEDVPTKIGYYGKEFDEICVGAGAGCAIHLEKMTRRTFWMGIYRGDGQRWSFWITWKKDGTIKNVVLEEEPGEEHE